MMECQEHCNLKMPCVQASEAETKKYKEVQQSEQSAFQASIVDLDQAVAAMQSYTDMSAATAVAEEVPSLSRNTMQNKVCQLPITDLWHGPMLYWHVVINSAC